MESEAIIEAVASHAMASGYFERVNQFEPKSSPGTGLVGSVWVNSIGPQVGASGLNRTSVRFTVNVRVYTSMLAEPADRIDPQLMQAVDALLAAYSGDFTLDGLVRNIDLLGMGGPPLGAEAGYVEIEKKLFRIMTITVPMILSDVWEQVA
jgi:hypothetical protein